MYRSSELCLEPRSCRKKQAGAALLVILLLLVSALSFLFVKNLNKGISFRSEDAMATANALAQAKAALIGYASIYPDQINPNKGPGYLPCPSDTAPYDMPRSNCAASTSSLLGRIPWRYLGVSDIRDEAGERLWYAITETYKYSLPVASPPLNSETPGGVTVDGAGDVVAVIIAPNGPLTGQSRNTGPNNASNYLEDENNNGDLVFATQASSPTIEFNDSLLAITRKELMEAVEKRVLGEARRVLQTYYSTNNYCPYAADLGSTAGSQWGMNGQLEGFLPIDAGGTSPNPPIPFSSPGWFRQNQWPNFVYYTLANACQSTTPGCSGSGLLTVGGATNAQALLISAGRTITTPPFTAKGSAQDRTSLPPPPPPWSVNEYLDSAENTNGDPVYDAAGTQITPSYNDQMKIVAP